MKQMEVVEKRIGENTFYIKPFAAFTAANLSGELAAIISPMLGGVASILGTSSEDGNFMDMDVEKAVPALSEAFSSLSGDKFEKLMRNLLITHENISVEGELTDGATRKLTYDLANEVFCGELQDMFLLCFEVLKLNFGGFFKKLGVQLGGLAEAIQKKIPSSTNTEPSTPVDSAT